MLDIMEVADKALKRLGGTKSLGFSVMLWKNLNELSGQPNMFKGLKQ